MEGDEGCRGLSSKYIKLVSLDMHEFYLEKKHAMLSENFRNMVLIPQAHGVDERQTERIIKVDYESYAVDVLCRYLVFKKSCQEDQVVRDFPISLLEAYSVFALAFFCNT